jgi:hypothetical protein
MKTLHLPTGLSVILPTGTSDKEAEAHQSFLEARYRFAMEYATRKGWPTNIDDLSFEQIMEIRTQPGWKTPQGETPLKVDAATFLVTGDKS